ncbi:hypothetical protein QTP70_029372, partial [Hemibagrus guttatus]
MFRPNEVADGKMQKAGKWVFETVGKFPFTTMATESYLVHEEASRGAPLPECFLVPDTYR